jgi:hypothetical protein
MTKSITYSLVNSKKDSGSFYTDLGVFTDSLLNEIDPEVNQIVGDFFDFIKKNKIEYLRSANEYLVEFLMIGVYWNNYSGNASKTGFLSKKLLNTLYLQRKRHPKYKAEIDMVRGYLAYSFLEKNRKTLSDKLNCKGFISLLNWLSATGEFNE